MTKHRHNPTFKLCRIVPLGHLPWSNAEAFSSSLLSQLKIYSPSCFFSKLAKFLPIQRPEMLCCFLRPNQVIHLI